MVSQRVTARWFTAILTLWLTTLISPWLGTVIIAVTAVYIIRHPCAARFHVLLTELIITSLQFVRLICNYISNCYKTAC